MSGRIVDFQKSPHQATQELLPWFASGTLEAAERHAVAGHLESCARCRQELTALQALQEDYITDRGSPSDMSGALARFWEKLPPQSPSSTTDVPRSPPPRPTSYFHHALSSYFGFALAAQFGIIVALSWTLWAAHNPPAAFHALGAAQSPIRVSGDAVIVFAPNVQERQMQRILMSAGARIVDGPTAANGYVIRFDGGDIEQSIAKLSSDPAVHLIARLALSSGG